jgi:hypothetical protein
MIDFIDIFDVYQHGKITGIGTLQADTDRRLTNTGDKLRDLEQRYERMALVTNGTPPIFLTPSLGVMMISEVSDGKANIYSGVQARGG